MQTEQQLREGANECVEEIRSLNAQLSGALVAGDAGKIGECATLLGMMGVCLVTVTEIINS